MMENQLLRLTLVSLIVSTLLLNVSSKDEGGKTIVSSTVPPPPQESKSYQKCREYARYVFENDLVQGKSDNSTKKINTCGKKENSDVNDLVPADPREFPHMVAIFNRRSNFKEFFVCNGVLISENFVLTAAHCSQSKHSGEPIAVVAGDLNLEPETDNANRQKINISKIFVHPSYKETDNDIALYQLESNVKLNNFVRPACLNIEENVKQSSFIVPGWTGSTAEGTFSKQLKKSRQHIAAQSRCIQDYSKVGFHNYDEDRMMCGEMTKQDDTCESPLSGSPLQYPLDEPYCMYSIIGITTYGKYIKPNEKCGKIESVYLKVSHYVPWIESIVWP